MTGYDFPDTEVGFTQTVGDLGTASLWQEANFAENLPYIHCYKVGGSEMGPLRTDRIQVDVYAVGRTMARDVAEAVCSRLTAGPHETDSGLIDSVSIEISPHGLPFVSDTVNLHRAVYRADTRAQ